MFPRGESAAAEKVCEALLHEPDSPLLPNLGLVGYGPDYLIFRTILVSSGLVQPLNPAAEPEQITWQVGRPTANKAMAHLWDLGQEFLQAAEGEEREAATLIDQLLSPPYGLRRGVLPVLLAAMLRPHLHVLTVRHNRKVVSPLTGLLLTDLCRKPEPYTLEVGPWDEQRQALWNVLQAQFQNFVGLQESTQQPLSYLSLALLRWLQSQPRFCRDTNRLAPEARQLRDLIRKAQRDPAQVLLYDLQALLAHDLDPALPLPNYEQALAARLNRWLSDIATAYPSLMYELDSFAAAEFSPHAPVAQRHGQAALTYWLTQVEQQTGQPLTNFRFSDALAQRFVAVIKQEADPVRFWEQLSFAVMGIYPHDWNDRSLDTFKQNLLAARDRLEHELLELREDEAVIELAVNLPGQETPQHYRFRPSDLSPHGQHILQNFISTLEIAGRPLSPDERRQVALAFLHYVMEGTQADDGRPRKSKIVNPKS